MTSADDTVRTATEAGDSGGSEFGQPPGERQGSQYQESRNPKRHSDSQAIHQEARGNREQHP